ncbi:MAG: CapA family protein [Solobacterium sp.]|nr:CapA family protein [Solobacterium sp.]
MKRKKLKKSIKILLAVLCTALLAEIILFFVQRNRKAEEEVAAAEETAVPEPASTPEPTPEVYKASLFITGDALIHGTVWKDAYQADGTYDFSGQVELVGKLAEGYDLKYYNQETILGGTELGLSGYPLFNSPQEVGDAMVGMGFNLVSTATNHSLDQGQTGIRRSHDYWKRQEDEHGVHMAGTYISAEEQAEIPVYEVNGITYTFLSWTYGCNGLLPLEGYEWSVNIYTGHEDEMLEQVRKADAVSDVTIVALHWGTEYSMEANEEQKRLAVELSEAGADILVGNHPHVIQPVEWVNDHKTICYYAMGNMISAQLEEQNLVGMVGGLDIVKTVFNGETTVEIKDPRADLIYTYYSNGYVNFKVIPFSQLDDAHLYNHDAVYEKYVTKINEYDDSIIVGMQ